MNNQIKSNRWANTITASQSLSHYQETVTDEMIQEVYNSLTDENKKLMMIEFNSIEPPRSSGPIFSVICSNGRYEMQLRDALDKYKALI
jgi:hypothetical protein